MKLQNLFVPDVFKSYYLLKNRCVGIHATATEIHVSIVEAKGYTRTLVTQHTYALSQEEDTKNFSAVLKEIKKEVGSYATLNLTISSSRVVFKELTLPFISREKIALVLPFEIEPYLPFSVAEAVIDFTVTSTNVHDKKSTIMVAAIQKKVIDEYVEPYRQAELFPTQVTVDIIGLFHFVRHFGTHHTDFALLALDQNSTALAYCPEHALKAVRTLDGPQNHTTEKAVAFTLNAFEEIYGPVAHALIAGTSSIELIEELEKTTHRSLQKLAIHQTDNLNNKIRFAGKITDTPALFSLAAAVPTEENTVFNLISLEIQQQQLGKLFSQQIIAAGLLSLLIVGSLAVHTVLQIKKLSKTAQTVKTETLKELKKRFPTIKTTNTSTALKTVQKEVALQQELWSAFSGSTSAYLYYLGTLSAAIDRDSLGLTLNKMIMNKKTITLEGKVQSFEALEALEKRLKESDLFVHIPDLQKTDFSLVLTLKPQGDAS